VASAGPLLCKSLAPCFRRIPHASTSALTHSMFYRPDAPRDVLSTVSNNWRQLIVIVTIIIIWCHHNLMPRSATFSRDRELDMTVVGKRGFLDTGAFWIQGLPGYQKAEPKVEFWRHFSRHLYFYPGSPCIQEAPFSYYSWPSNQT